MVNDHEVDVDRGGIGWSVDDSGAIDFGENRGDRIRVGHSVDFAALLHNHKTQVQEDDARALPSIPRRQGGATNQRSLDSRAYDGECMLAVYAVDLFTVINHHKEIDYWILTVGTGGYRLSRAIRVDGIGPGVLVPTGVERSTVDNCVLQPL